MTLTIPRIILLGTLFFVLASLYGCEDDKDAGVKDITSDYKMEGVMENCTIHRVISKRTWPDLTAVYCDGKQTTSVRVPSGKSAVTRIIINGVEYEATVKKEQQ